MPTLHALAFSAPPRLRSLDRHERKVTWLELFFDLTFVAAVSHVGSPLADDLSPSSLVRYAALFSLVWSAWIGHTLFATRFDTDDVVQRVVTVVQMCAVAVMAVNGRASLGSTDTAGFAAAYAAIKALLVVQYFRARQLHTTRPLTTHYLVGCALSTVLWLGAALVDPPVRFWLWGVALAVDLGLPVVAERHSLRVPPDAAHLPERFGLFTLILLGETVVAIMRGMEQQAMWSAPAAVSAFTGIGIAFIIWWWYYDGAGGADPRQRRRANDVRRDHVWSLSHPVLYLALAVLGVSLEHIVRSGGHTPLHTPESLIVGGAAALAAACLLVIGRTSQRPAPPALAWMLVPAAAALPVAAQQLGGWSAVVAIALLFAAELEILRRGQAPSAASDGAAVIGAVGMPSTADNL